MMRACLLFLLVTCALGAVEQLVLLDEKLEVDSAFKFFPTPKHSPENWTAPIDYPKGQIHVWLHIEKKASDTAFKHQICLFQGKHHACTQQRLISATGIGETSEQLGGIWNAGKHDWTKQISKIMLVTKDANGKPVSDMKQFKGKWAGSPDFSLYFPYTVHCVITLVPPGATYQAPGRLGNLDLKKLNYFPKAVAACREQAFGGLLQAASSKLESENQALAKEAKQLHDALYEEAQRQLSASEKMLADNPLQALRSYQTISKQWHPSDFAKQASEKLKELKKDRDFKKSLKAWEILESMQTAAAKIERPFDRENAKQLERHKKDLQLLYAGLTFLRKKYKDSAATEKARAVCQELGLIQEK